MHRTDKDSICHIYLDPCALVNSESSSGRLMGAESEPLIGGAGGHSCIMLPRPWAGLPRLTPVHGEFQRSFWRAIRPFEANKLLISVLQVSELQDKWNVLYSSLFIHFRPALMRTQTQTDTRTHTILGNPTCSLHELSSSLIPRDEGKCGNSYLYLYGEFQ